MSARSGRRSTWKLLLRAWRRHRAVRFFAVAVALVAMLLGASVVPGGLATPSSASAAVTVDAGLSPAVGGLQVQMGSVPLPPTGNITVTACEGTTSAATSTGALNTPGSFTLAGTAAADLRVGKTVFLYDNLGRTITDAGGNYISQGVGGVPYCGAKLDPATGLVTSTWRFCTDEADYGCANRPPSEVATNPKLSSTQASQIASLLLGADILSKRARAMTQIQVWCISENISPGTVFTAAQSYFNSNQFNGSGWEGADLTAAEATCKPRPVVPAAPTLTVVGPTADVNIGATAQFVVTPNFTGPVTISVTGGSGMALCPAAQSGVTLSGNTLTFTTAVSATLCVTATQSGTLELSAVAANLPSPDELTFIWNNDPTCQVFVDYTVGARLTVTASDTVTVKAVSIGDYVWWDVDRDGVQDAGEAPVAGITVNLLNAAGAVVATTTTDANGYYYFANLTPSTQYTVVFVKPADATFTTQNSGANDAVDSDANPLTGQVPVTTPASGSNVTGPGLADNPTIDAGLVKMNLALTKTLVTAGPFLPGMTVTFTLVPHNDGPVNALAGWSVTDVLPTGLTLVSMAGNGYVCTAAKCVSNTPLAAGADGAPITVTATIDAAFTGTAHNVAYISPAPADVKETNPLVVPTTSTDTSTTPTDNDAQAALTVDRVSIGDYVWWDDDRDGQQDSTETPVPGVTVNLLDSNGNVVATTTTNANGYYFFADLLPSTEYTVQFVKPEGTLFTSQDSGAVTDNSPTGDVTDSDADIVTGLVAVITPATGANLTGPGQTDNPGIDAGLVRSIPLHIEKLGEDVNGDWTRMDGSSWSILQDDNGQPGMAIAFSIVDVSTGLFQIDAFPAGTYWLTELTAPDGFNLLAQPVQFTINPDGTVSITSNGGGAVTASGQLITVRDVPALVMPETGGTGTLPFLIGGVLLLAGAGGLAFFIRRRSRRAVTTEPHDPTT